MATNVFRTGDKHFSAGDKHFSAGDKRVENARSKFGRTQRHPNRPFVEMLATHSKNGAGFTLSYSFEYATLTSYTYAIAFSAD